MKRIVELKIFKNGGSNAVRIPASVKLPRPFLYLEIDDETEDLGLYKESPKKFARLFELLDASGPIPEAVWGPQREMSHWPNRASLSELDGQYE